MKAPTEVRAVGIFAGRARPHLSAVVCMASLLLCACTPSVRQVRQPASAPATFSRSGAAPLPDRWWRSFNDPILNRLISHALKDSFSLRTAWDRLAQASARARKAGAPLIPAVNATVGGSGNFTNSALGNTGSIAIGLAASYEVDLWGRVRSARNAARMDVRASRESLTAAGISLSAQVATTWFRLVEKHAQLALLKRQATTNRKMLEVVTLRFRLGRSAATDVLQQRQTLEARRGELAQTTGQAKVLAHQLAVLLGKPPKTVVATPSADLAALPPLPRTGVPARLVTRRPDVRAVWYRVRAANHLVAAAIADRFPQLSLTVSGSNATTSVDSPFGNWLLNLAANLVAPLIDGGRRKAEVARTRAAASEALNEYGETVLRAFKEVEDALAREAAQVKLLGSLKRQLRLSSMVIDRARHSYTNGSGDFLRLLDAMLRHQGLQRSNLSARSALLENRISLYRALAGGWKMSRPSPRKSGSSSP